MRTVFEQPMQQKSHTRKKHVSGGARRFARISDGDPTLSESILNFT